MNSPSVRAVMMSVVAACIGIAATAAAAAADMPKRFAFVPGAAGEGAARVEPQTLYSDERGYGFDPDRPTRFSVKVPEGNHRVTITFGDEHAATDTTVKAESRRLMVERLATKPGEFVTRSFTVNVRNPRLPDGRRRVGLKGSEAESLNWDEKLTLEFLGERPGVRSVEVTPAPQDTVTVYIAGDSTVTDGSREPWSGWGQMLPRFFKPTVAVANHAHSGEALRSFRGERRLDKILSQTRPGDWLLIQFGHNDQKDKSEGAGAFTTYREDLLKYAAAARDRGAKPVFVTSMHRRRFGPDGKVTNSLGDYPQAMRQAAAELSIPLIDLHAMSKALYEALGEEGSKQAFVFYPANTFPGQDEPLKDNSHFNNYGAYELARCVVEGIRTNVPDLAVLLAEDVTPFDPARPDPVETWTLPTSPQAATPSTKPAGS